MKSSARRLIITVQRTLELSENCTRPQNLKTRIILLQHRSWSLKPCVHVDISMKQKSARTKRENLNCLMIRCLQLQWILQLFAMFSIFNDILHTVALIENSCFYFIHFFFNIFHDLLSILLFAFAETCGFCARVICASDNYGSLNHWYHSTINSFIRSVLSPSRLSLLNPHITAKMHLKLDLNRIKRKKKTKRLILCSSSTLSFSNVYLMVAWDKRIVVCCL